MAHKIIDRCKETTSTTGTGTLTLTGAVANFVAVADATAGLTVDGDTSWFCAENGAEWEVFLGTRVDATHLARTTVISSSNAGAAVSFTAAPTVFGTVPASKLSTVGPAFSAYRATSNQTLVTATPTKVQLNAEEFDTNSCFDSTTNFRFQPNVAGYYRFEFGCGLQGTTVTAVYAALFKNGAEIKRGVQANFTSGNVSFFLSGGSALIYLNGTTDYVELWGYCSATSPVVLLGAPYSFLSGAWARPG
jgi:hypothetical protein